MRKPSRSEKKPRTPRILQAGSGGHVSKTAACPCVSWTQVTTTGTRMIMEGERALTDVPRSCKMHPLRITTLNLNYKTINRVYYSFLRLRAFNTVGDKRRDNCKGTFLTAAS